MNFFISWYNYLTSKCYVYIEACTENMNSEIIERPVKEIGFLYSWRTWLIDLFLVFKNFNKGSRTAERVIYVLSKLILSFYIRDYLWNCSELYDICKFMFPDFLGLINII